MTVNIAQVNFNERGTENLLIKTERFQKIIFALYYFLAAVLTKNIKLILLIGNITSKPLNIVKNVNLMVKTKLANIISFQDINIPILKRAESLVLRKPQGISRESSIDIPKESSPIKKEKEENYFDFLNLSNQNILLDGVKIVLKKFFPSISEDEIGKFQNFLKKVII